ncbi:MAG TPA: glycerophosphodiester phosphodiesterase [Burkholderiales bacterium]|jgi:glycerophosphoryl diester phosphodiesterase
MPATQPIVIAHRGASGYMPEHTLAAYYLAIEQGADFVEPDLVATRDGALVVRHENEIGATTDVSAHPEFAARRARKIIDGEQVEGWFTEDFTLAELKTLRARERLPQLRPGNTRVDGMFEVPTLDEVLALVQAVDWQRRVLAQQDGRPEPPPIGVYPETKHPSYFAGIGLPLEAGLVRALQRWGYAGRDAAVFIQSFESANLRALRRMSELRLVQLVDSGDRPHDLVLAGDPRTASDLLTPRGLAEIASYADAVGVNKSLVIPCAADGSLAAPTTLVADAHAAGLLVHAWTFRAENEFLPKEFRYGSDPAALGDMIGEVRRFLAAGIDGLFTDQPDQGVRALRRN